MRIVIVFLYLAGIGCPQPKSGHLNLKIGNLNEDVVPFTKPGDDASYVSLFLFILILLCGDVFILLYNVGIFFLKLLSIIELDEGTRMN